VDGAPALNTAIGLAAGGNSVAADRAGNLYLAAAALNRVFRVSPDGAIATVAGNGTASYSGDGGPATQAGLFTPFAVALDAAGNLYIADYNDNRIRMVSNGIITTVAGNGGCCFGGDGGPATSAPLAGPVAIAVDARGRIYINDGGALRMVSGGIITMIGPSGTGLAVDAAGNIYCADGNHNTVYKVLAESTAQLTQLVTIAGNGNSGFSGDGGPAVEAALTAPSSVAVSASGAIFIADYGNNRIRKIENGIISTIAGNGASTDSGDGGPAADAALLEPIALALFGADDLYVGKQDNRVRKILNGIVTTVAGNGNTTLGGEGGLAISAQLGAPNAVAVDSSGDLFFLDGSRAYEVSRGIVTVVAGNGTSGYAGDGGPATSAQFQSPGGLAADHAGNLFIADSGNNRIRMVSNGVITTVAGTGSQGYTGDGGPATSAQLWYPTGVAVDSAGSLYIADFGNQCIRKVSGGIITTVAGNGTFGSSGDGGPAVSAQFGFPEGVAVDDAGSLYIADTYNRSIRKVSDGIITTVVTIDDHCGGSNLCPAGVHSPRSVAVDPWGSVYFDLGSGSVQRFSEGVLSTFAGSGQFSTGFAGDGGPALGALLNYPLGVAADDAGNISIADSSNGRIRKVARRSLRSRQIR